MRWRLLAVLALVCLGCSSKDDDQLSLQLPDQPDPGGTATGDTSTIPSPNAGPSTSEPPATSGSNGNSSTGATQPTGVAAGCTPNLGCQLDVLPSTGDPYQDCVDRINQFRTTCACLGPLERWAQGEACADQQAEYDVTQGAHAGFGSRICDGGNAQNECPGWRSVDQVVDRCLQSMWDEGPPPQDPCDGQCFQDHGHFLNMTSERSTKVACGFYQTPAGQFWAVQNFAR